jgi:hypothetical protein
MKSTLGKIYLTLAGIVFTATLAAAYNHQSRQVATLGPAVTPQQLCCGNPICPPICPKK